MNLSNLCLLGHEVNVRVKKVFITRRKCVY